MFCFWWVEALCPKSGMPVSNGWKRRFWWVDTRHLPYTAPPVSNPSPQTFVDQDITSFGEGFENERRTGDITRSLGSVPALLLNYCLFFTWFLIFFGFVTPKYWCSDWECLSLQIISSKKFIHCDNIKMRKGNLSQNIKMPVITNY